MYTTVPASPLRSALTLDVKSLPFKPSLPVKPLSPATASVAFGSLPVPALPSRPSVVVLPIFAALSMTLRVASSKPMLTTPSASVEIAIPVFGVAASAPVAPTVPVPDLKCKPVPTATCLTSVSVFAL